MRKEALIMLAAASVCLAGCQGPGQGSPGTSSVQSGSARVAGSVPYGFGLTPDQESGMPDQAIADSRAEAGLQVSPEGDAELARRSEAATLGSSPSKIRPSQEPASQESGDQILLEQIQLALSSTTPQLTPVEDYLSIETLNNIQIHVYHGIVTITGPVRNYQVKKDIEARIKAIPGVELVRDRLQVVSPPPPDRLPQP
jgi:osmotically-inducible protein OsmY